LNIIFNGKIQTRNFEPLSEESARAAFTPIINNERKIKILLNLDQGGPNMLEEKSEEKEVREVTPWTPSRGSSHGGRKMEVVYENLSKDPAFGLLKETKNQEGYMIHEPPTIEVHVENNGLLVKVDLSTMGQDDLLINLQGDLLTIKKQKNEEELKEQRYGCSRFVYGSFDRWG
jgi:HSP20 family molecular chaperone IbpA